MKYLWLFLLLLFPTLGWCDLVCDGTNDTVTMASSTGAPQTYPVTVTAIVQPNSLAVTAAVTDVGSNQAAAIGGYIVLVASTGALIVYNTQSTLAITSTAATMTVGGWYYLAWTAASATSHRFFAWHYQSRSAVINETSTTNLGALTVSTSPVKVCHSLGGAGTAQEFLNGTVRQVAYYNKDWTASPDVFRAMAYLGPLAVASPTLLYNFQAVSGTTIRDQQGSANNGALANFTGTFWVPMSYPRPFWVN